MSCESTLNETKLNTDLIYARTEINSLVISAIDLKIDNMTANPVDIQPIKDLIGLSANDYTLKQYIVDLKTLLKSLHNTIGIEVPTLITG